ncbi:DoxX [Pirellula sp. SH-Sr6A]|uniref:hypothetical protein n=1 Tax=Pirellula sp. SH-Sr6A TaxID=1632865 RepID=UPI00078C4EF6|nr:hypothetical protein [Pirellula sp. SH-Sr6A]AMV35175.1 DoxX [Pirellula sp. SH-Sr6A]
MLLRKARLSLLAILFLVALRFVVGFHFYMEGATKVKEGNFSSTGFLAGAKGPLADKFHQLIPDYDGRFRLPELREQMPEKDQKPTKEDSNKLLSYKKLFEHLDAYAANAKELYGFTEEQSNKVDELVNGSKEVTGAKEKLIAVADDWGPQISEYLVGFERVAINQRDEMRNNVAGLRKQKDEIESKWRALVKAPLADVDSILADLETKVNAIAKGEQKGEKNKQRYAELRLPDAGPIDVKMVDRIIPIFDMTVGILLMIGLLTPLAALAAGLFLASVVLTQFPGYPGAQPTYYQGIEMLACFLLAFTDAGRYAGLDFIPWSFWNRGTKKADAE